MNTETRPVKSENKVVKVTKLADGGLECLQASGEVFVVPASETDIQAFVIFTMVYSREL